MGDQLESGGASLNISSTGMSSLLASMRYLSSHPSNDSSSTASVTSMPDSRTAAAVSGTSAAATRASCSTAMAVRRQAWTRHNHALLQRCHHRQVLVQVRVLNVSCVWKAVLLFHIVRAVNKWMLGLQQLPASAPARNDCL